VSDYEDDLQYSDDDTYDDCESRPSQPPPSYRDEESIRSRSSHTSEAYSNLMNFLDAASTSHHSPTKPIHSRHNNNDDDDMSSISHSMSSPFRSNTANHSESITGKRFVWDELDVNPSAGTSVITHSDDVTFFKPPSYHSNRSDASVSTLKTNIEEVKQKVDSMKSELKVKSKLVKELQSELTRLKAAKSRKKDRATNLWDKKLQTLREENANAFKRQNDFLSKVTEDVKKLISKCEVLEARIGESQRLYESKVKSAEDEASRSKRRARRQLEADERQVFEKLAASKSQSMQKTAADMIGPQLEALVTSNRDKITKLKEDGEKRLIQKTKELRSDLQAKHDVALKGLRERLDIEDDSGENMRQRKVREVSKRHSDEIASLQQRFQQEKAIVDQNADRRRRINADSILEQTGLFRQTEKEAIADLTSKQQRELNSLISSHMRDMERLRDELEREFEQWKENVKQQEEFKANTHEKEVQTQLKREAVLELENIRTKLREESAKEREKIKKQIDDEVEAARLKINEGLVSMQESSANSAEMIADLEQEVGHLKRRLASQRSTNSYLQEEISNESTTLKLATVDGIGSCISSTLPEDADVGVPTDDDSLSSYNTTGLLLAEEQRDFDARLRQKEDEVRWEREKMRSEVESEKSHRDEMNQQQQMEITNKKQEMADEIRRIEDKISTLLRARDAAIGDMRKVLSDLRHNNVTLEEALDEYRTKKIASVEAK